MWGPRRWRCLLRGRGEPWLWFCVFSLDIVVFAVLWLCVRVCVVWSWQMKCRVLNELSRELKEDAIHAFQFDPGFALKSGAASLSHASISGTLTFTLQLHNQHSLTRAPITKWSRPPNRTSTSPSSTTPSPKRASPHPNPPTFASAPYSTPPPPRPKSSQQATRSRAPATRTPSKPAFSNSPQRTPSPLPQTAKQKIVSGLSCPQTQSFTQRWSHATSGLRGT